VNSVTAVDEFEDRTLIKLDWDASQDHLFRCILEHDGQILSATGSPKEWNFEIRFSERESLSQCQDCCADAHITLDLTRIYNPVDPKVGPWYGLSKPQREALTLAVRMGYYDIPRGCTTAELADELGISDQATTETASCHRCVHETRASHSRPNGLTGSIIHHGIRTGNWGTTNVYMDENIEWARRDTSSIDEETDSSGREGSISPDTILSAVANEHRRAISTHWTARLRSDWNTMRS